MGKRVMKTILAMSMILCLAVGNMTVAQAAGSKKTVKATSVVLNKSVYTLKKGGTVKLKATIAPKKATTRTLLWSSSNKKVATVDKAGKVKAKKNGKATITVKVKSTSKKGILQNYRGNAGDKGECGKEQCDADCRSDLCN